MLILTHDLRFLYDNNFKDIFIKHSLIYTFEQKEHNIDWNNSILTPDPCTKQDHLVLVGYIAEIHTNI